MRRCEGSGDRAVRARLQRFITPPEARESELPPVLQHHIDKLELDLNRFGFGEGCRREVEEMKDRRKRALECGDGQSSQLKPRSCPHRDNIRALKALNLCPQ